MADPDKVVEEEVRELIDTSEFTVHDDIDEDYGFNWSFGVETADDAGFVVYSKLPVSGGPVGIMSETKIDPGLLYRHMEGKKDEDDYIRIQKQHFQTLLISILTNTPGRFLYLNADDEPCGFNEMRKIRFQHRIYSDALSQHTLLNGIIDQLSARESISEIVEQYESIIDEHR